MGGSTCCSPANRAKTCSFAPGRTRSRRPPITWRSWSRSPMAPGWCWPHSPRGPIGSTSSCAPRHGTPRRSRRPGTAPTARGSSRTSCSGCWATAISTTTSQATPWRPRCTRRSRTQASPSPTRCTRRARIARSSDIRRTTTGTGLISRVIRTTGTASRTCGIPAGRSRMTGSLPNRPARSRSQCGRHPARR